MLRDALICFTKSGISSIRMTRVSPMIDSAQDAPPAGSMPIAVNSLCQASMIAEMA